jgi:hypothetical protein
VFFSFVGAIVYFSAFFQQVQGHSPISAGVDVSAIGVAFALAAPLSGRLVGRVGPLMPMLAGLSIAGGATLGLLRLDMPELADGDRPASVHQEVERLIRASGLRWTFLRAVDFATKTLAWADQIKHGVVWLPYGQASRSLIHERDVADVAVHVLTTAGHDGAKYLITRPESIIQAELAMIIGEAAGREVRWEDLPLQQARQQLDGSLGKCRLRGREAEGPGGVRALTRASDWHRRASARPTRVDVPLVAEEHRDDFR